MQKLKWGQTQNTAYTCLQYITINHIIKRQKKRQKEKRKKKNLNIDLTNRV